MAKRMLIDATHPEETRVVVVKGTRLEEFDFETSTKLPLKGNIYLAKVVRVEPSLQAAFVEYGGNRHGFLAFSEIHPDYYQIPIADRQALLARQAAEAAAEEEAAEAAADAAAAREPEEAAAHARGESAEDGEPAAEAETSAPEPEPDFGFASDGPGTLAASTHQTMVSSPAFDAVADDHGADDHGAADRGDNAAEAGSDSAAEDGAADAPSGWPSFPDLAEGEPATADPAAATGSDGAMPAPEGGPIEGGAGESAPGTLAGNVVSVENDGAADVTSVGGDDLDEVAPRRSNAPYRAYKIQEVIKRRQILLIQVVKEERGNKGAALTTFISLAGRYCVLMPNTARGGGISRKIVSAIDRKRLKAIVSDLDVPGGMGVILRTAGLDRSKAEIKRDFEYLVRLWDSVRELTLRSSAPCLVYEEGSLIKRAIRDYYSSEIEEILIEGEEAYRVAKDFMRMLMPSHAKRVQPYRDRVHLFHRYQVEQQFDSMYSPTVQLRSGGYIVINPTEALVSIDVNSGKSTREHNIEETAYKTNLEAAEEVARQLRLRDLAGLIVIDFIDMEDPRNNRNVERRLKDSLKSDRARIQVGRISAFGLMEMSRQRLRPSLLESSTELCRHCQGRGYLRSTESTALHLLRAIEDEGIRDRSAEIVVHVATPVALYLLNQKRPSILDIESRYGMRVLLEADDSLVPPNHRIERRATRAPSAETARLAPTHIHTESVMPVDLETEEDEPDTAMPVETAPRESAPASTPAAAAETGEPRRRRRRRRRRGGEEGVARANPDERGETAAGAVDAPAEIEEEDAQGRDAGGREDAEGDAAVEDGGVAKRRRRGRRGGRRRRREDETAPESAGGGFPAPGDELAALGADPQPNLAEAERMIDPDAPVEPDAPDAPDAPAVPVVPVAPVEPAASRRAPRRRRSEPAAMVTAEAEAIREEEMASPATAAIPAIAPPEPVAAEAAPKTADEADAIVPAAAVAPATPDAPDAPAVPAAPPRRGWWRR